MMIVYLFVLFAGVLVLLAAAPVAVVVVTKKGRAWRG